MSYISIRKLLLQCLIICSIFNSSRSLAQAIANGESKSAVTATGSFNLTMQLFDALTGKALGNVDCSLLYGFDKLPPIGIGIRRSTDAEGIVTFDLPSDPSNIPYLHWYEIQIKVPNYNNTFVGPYKRGEIIKVGLAPLGFDYSLYLPPTHRDPPFALIVTPAIWDPYPLGSSIPTSPSRGGFLASSSSGLYGISSKLPVPEDRWIPLEGDYDGDKIRDLAFFDSTTARWEIVPSFDFSEVGSLVTFGAGGPAADIPVAADFDGDGKTDIAVFRPSTSEWFYRSSYDGIGRLLGKFGKPDLKEIPVPADFDGDGRADLAVFDPSTAQWHYRPSKPRDDNVSDVFLGSFGGTNLTDLPVPTDYDGDGRADLAIFRSSTNEWFVKKSSTGQGVKWLSFVNTLSPQSALPVVSSIGSFRKLCQNRGSSALSVCAIKP